MKKCESCKREYPSHLVQPMAIGGGGGLRYKHTCPICALISRNEMMGLPIETPFSGEVANELFEEAYAYAEKQGWIPEVHP